MALQARLPGLGVRVRNRVKVKLAHKDKLSTTVKAKVELKVNDTLWSSLRQRLTVGTGSIAAPSQTLTVASQSCSNLHINPIRPLLVALPVVQS